MFTCNGGLLFSTLLKPGLIHIKSTLNSTFLTIKKSLCIKIKRSKIKVNVYDLIATIIVIMITAHVLKAAKWTSIRSEFDKGQFFEAEKLGQSIYNTVASVLLVSSFREDLQTVNAASKTLSQMLD